MTDSPERTVLVDTDGGVDDALAVLLLARTAGVRVAAAGSVHGNVTAAAAATNTLRVLELAGDTTTPVAVGAADPLAQPRHLAHPEDLLGAFAGAPRRAPIPTAAAEHIVQLTRAHAGEVEVLAVGPLTNLALALQIEPDLPRMVRRAVVMGGAFSTEGNLGAAEANIGHDPEAAHAVLGAGFADLTLVPLDLTRTAAATRPWLQALAADTSTLWGQFAALLLLTSTGDLPPMPLHDPLAAAILLYPQLAKTDPTPVTVELSDRAARGRTRRAAGPGQPPVKVATAVDVDAFRELLLTALAPHASTRSAGSSTESRLRLATRLTTRLARDPGVLVRLARAYRRSR